MADSSGPEDWFDCAGSDRVATSNAIPQSDRNGSTRGPPDPTLFYIWRAVGSCIATGFSGLRLDCVGITDCVGLFYCVPGHAVGFEFGLL